MKQVMKNILLSLLMFLLLSSCSSRDSAKLDSLLSVANSSTSKNLAKIASSSDPKSAAKALLEHKRDQWQRDRCGRGDDFYDHLLPRAGQ